MWLAGNPKLANLDSLHIRAEKLHGDIYHEFRMQVTAPALTLRYVKEDTDIDMPCVGVNTLASHPSCVCFGEHAYTAFRNGVEFLAYVHCLIPVKPCYRNGRPDDRTVYPFKSLKEDPVTLLVQRRVRHNMAV